MKIAFINSNLEIGGAERTVEYLANNFCNKCDVDVISIDGSNKLMFDKRVNLFKFNIPKFYSNILQRFKLIIKRLNAVKSYLKNNCPDVVVCVQCENIKYVQCFQKKYGYKIISSERANPKNVDDEKYLEKSDGIVFQTQRAKEYYPQKVQKKSIVIQNAVGNLLVSTIIKPIERKKIIVAMGRVCKEKDYKTLIDAFSIVNKIYPKYRLAIYGDRSSEYSTMIHGYVDIQQCKDNIDIYPATMDALKYVNECSCYVLSSISEGLPNALMEAMAIGMPCVATDCNNGPAELIEDGVNGLLVPTQNAQAMADAIIRIISDKEFADKLGNEAQKILDTNSIGNIANMYYDYIVSFVTKNNLR